MRQNDSFISFISEAPLFFKILGGLILCTNAPNKIEIEGLYDNPNEAISSYFSENNITSAIGYNIDGKTVILVEQGMELYSMAELIKDKDKMYIVVKTSSSVLIDSTVGADWTFPGMDGSEYRIHIRKTGHKAHDKPISVYHEEMGLHIAMEIKESDHYISVNDYKVLKSR